MQILLHIRENCEALSAQKACGDYAMERNELFSGFLDSNAWKPAEDYVQLVPLQIAHKYIRRRFAKLSMNTDEVPIR